MRFVSDRTCAKCGRDIASNERPWTFTGTSRGDLDTEPGETVLVCEDCYEDLDTS